MSVAGGLPLAVDRAVAHGCAALQIFAKNANQWRGRPLPADEVREFRRRIDASGIAPVVSHASYLINLATKSPALQRQSIDAMGDEIDRAEALGLLGVVLHPGCSTHGDVAGGLDLVGDALLELFKARRRGKTMVLLEHTAGQGSSLGASFEEIAAILARMHGHRRVGVCLDTCHLIAAGYDIATETGYRATFKSFDRLIGFERLKVVHANDSKKPLGSRVDRHTHIGEGFVGVDGFRRIVNDRRFAGLPMLLETPKAAGRKKTKLAVSVDAYDERNLSILRGLVRQD
jgi:deoxyribonuclease-4